MIEKEEEASREDSGEILIRNLLKSKRKGKGGGGGGGFQREF